MDRNQRLISAKSFKEELASKPLLEEVVMGLIPEQFKQRKNLTPDAVAIRIALVNVLADEVIEDYVKLTEIGKRSVETVLSNYVPTDLVIAVARTIMIIEEEECGCENELEFR